MDLEKELQQANQTIEELNKDKRKLENEIQQLKYKGFATNYNNQLRQIQKDDEENQKHWNTLLTELEENGFNSPL